MVMSRTTNGQDNWVLLVGHGTRDADGEREFQACVAAVRAVAKGPVAAAYIEIRKPLVADALIRLADQGARSITVVPLVLTSGRHWDEDLPQALRAVWRPGLRLCYSRPLLHDEAVFALARERVRTAIARHQIGGGFGLWVIARGSHRAEVDREVGAFADRLGQAVGAVRTGHGYVSVGKPTLEDMLAGRRVVEPVVVFPLFLFAGVLTKRIASLVARSAAHERLCLAAHLGPDERLVRAILRAANEAGPVTVANGTRT